ncbi:hypothetical protein ACLOJK_023843 [Asimina triloba]
MRLNLMSFERFYLGVVGSWNGTRLWSRPASFWDISERRGIRFGRANSDEEIVRGEVAVQ